MSVCRIICSRQVVHQTKESTRHSAHDIMAALNMQARTLAPFFC